MIEVNLGLGVAKEKLRAQFKTTIQGDHQISTMSRDATATTDTADTHKKYTEEERKAYLAEFLSKCKNSRIRKKRPDEYTDNDVLQINTPMDWEKI